MSGKYFGGPLLLLTLWFCLAEASLFPQIFFPHPLDVLETFSTMILSGLLVNDLFHSFYRVLLAFILGILLGVPIGALMGYVDAIYKYLEIIVDFFRSIPVAALFPFFLLVFGTGDVAKVTTAAWSTCLIILVNTMYGVRHSKKIRVMVAKTMRMKEYQIFFKVILPDALPNIFAGLRVGISIALIVIIMSEMFTGTYIGLGLTIYNSSLLYQTSQMFCAIITTGLLGYFFNKVIILLEKRVVHWTNY